MTMAEWCDHCDMRKEYCPHGNPGAGQDPKPGDCTEGQGGPTIKASMPGECVTCGGDIEVDDRITHVHDGWVHAAPEQATPPDTGDLFGSDWDFQT